jgi:hypothetical protein
MPGTTDLIGQLAIQIAEVPSLESQRTSMEELLVTQLGQETELWPLVENIRRYLVEAPDLRQAVRFLLYDQRAAIDFAVEQAEKHQHALNARILEYNQALELILELAGLGCIRWPAKHRGITRIKRTLEDTWIDIRSKKSGNIRPQDQKHYGKIGWDYLETLLKIAIRYYARLFGSNEADGNVGSAFRHALQRDSLHPLLEAIQEIQKQFNPNNLKHDARAVQLSQYLLGRPSPFSDLLDGTFELKREDMTPEWRECVSQYLNSDEKKALENPGFQLVSVDVFAVFRADVRYYRDFYSHKDQDIVAASGSMRATKSFLAARRIIDRIADSDIQPTLIVPIELGRDGRGRELLRILREDQIGDDGMYDPDAEASLVFVGPSKAAVEVSKEDLRLFEFYACRTPVQDTMYEPPIYSLRDIYPEVCE